MSRRLLVALALAALWCAPARAVAPTPEFPLLALGNESAAYVEGARAVFYNPAGLGVRYPAELFVSWARREGGGEVNRWALGAGGFAVQGERVKDESQRAHVPEGAKIELREYRRPRPGPLQRFVGQAVSAAWRDATRMPEPGAALYWMDEDEAP